MRLGPLGRRARATAPLEVSEGRAFVLAKVPLKERYDVAYGGEARIHTPHMLIERIQEKKRRLSCVVDATLRQPGDSPRRGRLGGLGRRARRTAEGRGRASVLETRCRSIKIWTLRSWRAGRPGSILLWWYSYQ